MKDLEGRVAAFLAARLSPSARDIIAGVGQAFDPMPREYHKLFIASDLAAATADLEALFKDWCIVHRKLRIGRLTSSEEEVRHFHRAPAGGVGAKKEQDAQRERQSA